MKAHFIGNGASKNIFNQRVRYGFRVVGNIPKEIEHWDACSIIDHKMSVWISNTNKKMLANKDIWCSQDVAKWAKQWNLEGRWHAIYEPKMKFNSGHQAVQHLSKKFKFIDLWGMDSMWSEDLTSEMDDRVPRSKRPPLNREWRPHWRNLFKNNPECKYVIHAPTGIEKVDYGENCRYELH